MARARALPHRRTHRDRQQRGRERHPPTAIGKKNWLFIGAAAAGQRGAVLYTIVESCRRRGLDPLAYLRDVLTRLPKMTTGQIPEVTPEA